MFGLNATATTGIYPAGRTLSLHDALPFSAVSPRARDGIRLAVAALAAFWLIDRLLAAAAYAGIEDRSPLNAIRGFAVAALAPVHARAVHRNSEWSLRLSRTIASQSLSLRGIAVYVLLSARYLDGRRGGTD